jgi:serine/threonine protein kinase
MIGGSLGRYIIEDRRGEGGRGVVYRARDPQLGRIVALKILPSGAVAEADRRGT